MDNKSRIIITCPLCDIEGLQVIADDVTGLMQCLHCGYSTSNDYMGSINTSKFFKSLNSDIKKWAKEANGQIWIPSVLNTNVGMVYPIADNGDMKWAVAMLVDIASNEQKDYPNSAGGFYKKRYDIDNQKIFDTFSETIIDIDKNTKKQNPSIKLPKLKKINAKEKIQS